MNLLLIIAQNNAWEQMRVLFMIQFSVTHQNVSMPTVCVLVKITAAVQHHSAATKFKVTMQYSHILWKKNYLKYIGIYIKSELGPLLLTWFKFNSGVDK